MTPNPILAVGLDGFDFGFAERLMSEGALPNLRRLHDRSARYRLDHGRDRYSGLAWEHFSSGRSPSDGGRWSAVHFDPATYVTRQDPTSARPFLADLAARTVVFDLPYCDLAQAPRVRGATRWGAHDPGAARVSQPDGLHEELDRTFGPYPAGEWIYGFSWPSADKTRALSAALVRAVGVRRDAACWLLSERLPDWDLAVVVVSESHSAIEPLWHGVDPSHPLHNIESAGPAREGLGSIYAAIDDLIGTLESAFPMATLLVFAMHGMGPNEADVAAMALLPELLFRDAFGAPHMRPVSWPRHLPDGTPLLDEQQGWGAVVRRALPESSDMAPHSLPVARSMPGWMPATRYAPFWPRMRAFALPSYYDGRVRVNVEGREANGLVPRHEYGAVCNSLAATLERCRNLLTGEKAVAETYCPKGDPLQVGESEADLYVVWQTAPLGLSCPEVGDIGPLPYRRTGGHTGGPGFLYVSGNGILPGDRGLTSAFDVVPTIIELLGERPSPCVSGASLARGLSVAS